VVAVWSSFCGIDDASMSLASGQPDGVPQGAGVTQLLSVVNPFIVRVTATAMTD
jgi:hypothetical protein